MADVSIATAGAGSGTVATTSSSSAAPATTVTKRAPADFLRGVVGRPVTVRLTTGADYRGVLVCLDGHMNVAMEQTEEYVDGQLRNKFGDCFIRGNNDPNPHHSQMMDSTRSSAALLSPRASSSQYQPSSSQQQQMTSPPASTTRNRGAGLSSDSLAFQIPPPGVLQDAGPQTKLLEMRRQAFEVHQALIDGKDRAVEREKSFAVQEEELNKRDLELQSTILQMSNVVHDNDAKRQRAEKRATDEARTIQLKTNEIADGQVQLKSLKEEVDVLEAAVFKLSQYHIYMSYYLGLHSQEFADTSTIIARLATLKIAQRDLLTEQGKLLTSLEQARKVLGRSTKAKSTQALETENLLGKMRERLDAARANTFRLQQGAEEETAMRYDRTLELSLALQSIANLFQRCAKGPYGNTIKHSSADAEVLGYDVESFGNSIVPDPVVQKPGAPPPPSSSGAGGGGGDGVHDTDDDNNNNEFGGDDFLESKEDGKHDDDEQDADGDFDEAGALGETSFSNSTPGGGGGSGRMTSPRQHRRTKMARPPIFIAGGVNLRLGHDDDDAPPPIEDVTGMEPSLIRRKLKTALNQTIVSGAYILDFEAIVKEKDAYIAEQKKAADAKAAIAAAEAATKAEQLRAAAGKNKTPSKSSAAASSPTASLQKRTSTTTSGVVAVGPNAGLFSPINIGGAGGHGKVGSSSIGGSNTVGGPAMNLHSSVFGGGGGGVSSSLFMSGNVGGGGSPGLGNKVATAMAKNGVRAYMVPDTVQLPADLAVPVYNFSGGGGGGGGGMNARGGGGGVGGGSIASSKSMSGR